MATYEDTLGEAVQRLIAHGEQRGPVTEHFFDRLRREPELQVVLLGEALPDDPEQANRVIHERGVNAVHNLINRAVRRLHPAHNESG